MNKNYIILSFFAVIFALGGTHSVFAKGGATVGITSPISGVTIQVGTPQTIRWTSYNYPRGAGVNINLLRQTSSNSNKFEFVKTIKKDAANDGEEVWIPAIGESGNNLVIQVSCSQSFLFPEGCSSTQVSAHIAVTDPINRQSYSASVINAINEIIERLSNFLNSLVKR